MINEHIITAKKIVQNNQEFFLGTFTIRQILTFTKYTHRLISGYDDENKPIYNDEIQRKVENSRVEKIADFLINDPDALFPTNIVLSIPEVVIDNIEYLENGFVNITINEVVFKEVTKKDGNIYLTIIDGQHRIRGIEKAIERLDIEISTTQQIIRSSENKDFEKKLDYYLKRLDSLKNIELMVSFFIGPTLEFQAMIFSTINRTQKTVPQSLVYELFGLTANDSPQKTALQVVLSLNSHEKSPFFNRIKLYGGKYGINQSPPLTQAGMVKSIIDLISSNLRESEKDRFRSRKELIKNITPNLCFRKFYVSNQDDTIADILFSYYLAVRNIFKDENNRSLWEFFETNKPTNVLQTTVGYLGLLDILVDILKELKEDQMDKTVTYENYLIRAKGLDFKNQLRYPFTSKTRKIFYLDLSLCIWPPTKADDERKAKLKTLLIP